MRGIRRATAIATMALSMTMLVGTQTASAASGDLDDTFSDNGWRTIDFGGDDEWSKAVVVQADDKIVVAGWTDVNGQNNHDFAVARLLPNGALDDSFSGDGLVRTGFMGSNGPFDDYAEDVAIAPGGRIVVVGGSSDSFAIVRYKPNGTLDTTFSGDGKLRFRYGGRSADFALRVAALPDGKIVIAGQTKVVGQARRVALLRLTADGTLDDSFSGDGKRTVPLGTDTDIPGYMADMVVTSDGYATVLGTQEQAAAVRISPAGGLDPTFGEADGRYTPNLGTDLYTWAGTVDVSDRAVFAALKEGGSGDDVLFRSDPAGTGDDTTFGSGGIATVCPNDSCRIHAVAISGARILVVGVRLARGKAAYVKRFLGSGAPDPTWHAETVAGTNATDVVFVGNKAVVLGVIKDGLDFFVARYLGQ